MSKKKKAKKKCKTEVIPHVVKISCTEIRKQKKQKPVTFKKILKAARMKDLMKIDDTELSKTTEKLCKVRECFETMSAAQDALFSCTCNHH